MRMNLRSLLIGRILALAGLFSFAAAQSLAATEPVLHKVKLGLSAYQDVLVPYIGVIKGWYRQRGLDVDVSFWEYDAIPEALASGSIDVGVSNPALLIATHSHSPNLIYAYAFNPFDGGFALMIRPDGKIHPLDYYLKQGLPREEAIRQTALQLKGKTVITTGNTDMEQAVASFARKANLDFRKDITIKDIPPDEGLALFLSGVGDAYLGGIPQRTRAGKEGNIEMLYGTDLAAPPLNGFATTKQFLQTHEEDLLAIINVYFQTAKYINSDVDRGGAIIIKELNSRSGAQFTPADFRRAWNGLEHFYASPEEAQKGVLDPKGKNYWKNNWDESNYYFFEVVKTIPQPVDPDGFFIMEKIQKDYLKRYGNN